MREEATVTMAGPTGARARCGRPWLTALVLVAAACGSDAAAPAAPLPTLPESALSGYSVQTEALDARTIAAEVADPASVAPALEGMRSGTERRFSSRREPEQLVTSRTIRFASPAQAAGYVTWLDRNAADVLGASPRRETVDVAGSVAYSHDPSGCCPGKEMVWWLVAWARGADAFVLMVGGTSVRPGVVGSLASSLDAEADSDLS